MTVIIAILILIFVAGVAVGLYAWLAPRPAPVEKRASAPEPRERWTTTTDWTTQAGEEFAGLSESARCDLIFAVADLQDARSQQLLLHALDDPSEAVVLAAAHALARRGQGAVVQEYAQEHPGERAERIVRTLALME
jgi:HEAT repeat protein